jgi:hypothetical protein
LETVPPSDGLFMKLYNRRRGESSGSEQVLKKEKRVHYSTDSMNVSEKETEGLKKVNI